MKAMVLAAGLGTRLRPLTDQRPKALVTLGGKTLLEITLLTLRSFGVDEVIVNVHHFADMICEYLDENGNFGMHIEISHEDGELLDTGGGLKKAAWFFLEDDASGEIPPLAQEFATGHDFNRADTPPSEKLQSAEGFAKGHDFNGADTTAGEKPPSAESFVTGHDLSRAASTAKTDRASAPAGIHQPSDEPFILHNVDVLSTIDLERMVRHHFEHGALATLAVQQRETSRYLLFDENGHLCGRRKGRDGQPEMARPSAHPQPLAFAGIHVISPGLLTEMREEGAFSIIDAYLNLAARGEKIAAFRADEYYWRDLGRPENIADAERELESSAGLEN